MNEHLEFVARVHANHLIDEIRLIKRGKMNPIKAMKICEKLKAELYEIDMMCSLTQEEREFRERISELIIDAF